MERAGALINRLQEQYQQNAGADKMLITLQILAAELEMEKNKQAPNGRGVSVVGPVFLKTRPTVEETIDVPVAKPAPPAVEIEQKAAAPVEPQKPALPKIPLPVNFSTVKDSPTPIVQKPKEAAELNEIIGNKQESLNEQLRTGNVELGTVLQSSPVKDLKKAIGINDRYVFLNELFRGDDVMYERSIKTINAFTILAEAEYWIRRELKLKFAWNENSEAVHQFDQLVRRRFS